MNTIEQVIENVTGQFWTRQEEMIEDLEDMDYIVTEANGEYVEVQDAQDDECPAYILYIGRAHRTMWIERVRATQ